MIQPVQAVRRIVLNATKEKYVKTAITVMSAPNNVMAVIMPAQTVPMTDGVKVATDVRIVTAILLVPVAIMSAENVMMTNKGCAKTVIYVMNVKFSAKAVIKSA